jgi:hypothetical protein
MEKKTYRKPMTKIVELKQQQQLLVGSANLEGYSSGGHIEI